MKKWLSRVRSGVIKFAITLTVLVVAAVFAVWLVAIALSPIFMVVTVIKCW